DDSVGVVDLMKKLVVKRISVGTRPSFLALSDNGKTLVVSNYGSHNVSVIDTDRLDVVSTIVVDANPLGVAISRDQRFAFVANYHGQSVSQIDLTTMALVRRHSVAPHPYGVVVRRQGGELLVTHADSPIVSFWARGRWTRIAIRDGATSVALGRDGMLVYLAGFPAHRLSIFRGRARQK
ncbi:MAG: YncE family protein, partial [Myxococcales bacterium]|nr:YncE family protein [Myxococcales bacterium]